MKEHRTCFRAKRPTPFGWWSLPVILLLAIGGDVSAAAQPWGGDSSLGVLIRGKNGPVAGAIVEIRRQIPGLEDGPEARKTDGRGQANFVGVARGLWSLEIKHPDYLSFVASIHIERGRKPEVMTQFLEASGPGRGTFRVKFLRSDQALGEVQPGTATSAPIETRPVSTPASPFDRSKVLESKPDQRTAPRAVATEVVDTTPPAPQASAVTENPETSPVAEGVPESTAPGESQSGHPTPTAEVPVPLAQPPESPGKLPPDAPIPRPEADSSAEEGPRIDNPAPPKPVSLPDEDQSSQPEKKLPAPVAIKVDDSAQPPHQAPAMPTPAPTPAPAPATTQPDENPSMPVAEVPAGVSPSPEPLRAQGDGSCAECRPGEWAVAAQLEIPGGTACRPTAAVAVRRALRDVAATASEQLASFSGPLLLDPGVSPLSEVSLAARNTLAPYLAPGSSCRFLAVVVPHGGEFTGFRFEARDHHASGTCTGEQECEIGRARFLFSPAIAGGSGASIVFSLFENTGDVPRNARITGFFRPPNGWTPNE